MRLDHAWIASHIPHHGRMCLLDEVTEWDAARIQCRSTSHRAADHPLRSRGRLGAACGIEYAAQAMAIHGALAAGAGESDPGRAGEFRAEVGFLASLRDVRLYVARLDDIDGDLLCEATRTAGDAGSALYEFAVRCESGKLLSGRATVVLDADQRLKYE